MMGQRKDVFISYKDNDEGNAFAAELKKALENKGFSICYNPDEHRSADFTEKIRIAVENCKDFILIVSNKCLEDLMSGNKKDWVITFYIKHLNCKNHTTSGLTGSCVVFYIPLKIINEKYD